MTKFKTQIAPILRSRRQVSCWLAKRLRVSPAEVLYLMEANGREVGEPFTCWAERVLNLEYYDINQRQDGLSLKSVLVNVLPVTGGPAL